MRDVLGAKFNLFGVACDETKYGFNCTLDNSFQATRDGQWVLAKRLNEFKNWEIVKEQFQTGANVVFSQVHKEFIYTLILHEKLNVVMSGANDDLAVLYEWDSGQVITSIKMDIGLVKSSLLLDSTVVLGGHFTLGFLDLKTRKKTHITLENSLGTECDNIFSIVYTQFRENNQTKGVLLVGGSNSPIASRFRIKADLVEKLSNELKHPEPVSNQNNKKWDIIANEIDKLTILKKDKKMHVGPNLSKHRKPKKPKNLSRKIKLPEQIFNNPLDQKQKKNKKKENPKNKLSTVQKLKFQNLQLKKVAKLIN